MTPEAIRQRFGLDILRANDPTIRQIKQSQDATILHGNKIWKSSYVLMDYLLDHPLKAQSHVLELGCGWGLGSLFCQRQFDAHCVALDADEAVFPCLEAMAKQNNSQLPHVQMRFSDITVEQLAGFDVLIGADICFWDGLSEELFDLLDRALEAGVSRIVLSDPGRPPFRALAEQVASAQELPVTYSDWVIPTPFDQWGLILDIDIEANEPLDP